MARHLKPASNDTGCDTLYDLPRASIVALRGESSNQARAGAFFEIGKGDAMPLKAGIGKR